MLYLVGLGIAEGELSLNAIEALKNSEKIFLENYTTPVSEKYLLFLRSFGKEITELKRSDLEENAKILLLSAKKEKIAILVPGDPLIATTHHLLLIIAKNFGIQVSILHSSSIFSAAIAESGLDIYKFGPTTTITNWSSNYKPVSFLDVIEKNIQMNLHTLVLFDIVNNGERTLSVEEAIQIIIDSEIKSQKKFLQDRKILLLSDIGSNNKKILYATLLSEKLKKIKSKKLCMIVPAEPSFAEQELLELFS